MWLKPQFGQDAAEWLGDAHPLISQLGSADGLVSLHVLADTLHNRPVTSIESLHEFLQRYHEHVLIPHELSAIQTGFLHAGRNEARELTEADRQLSGEQALLGFAEASRRVGQAQLQKMRPLKDERVVQRYLHAVENGEAHGWHTLVYGLTLAVYSLPLRQGLLGYAHQTTRGFIHAAARSLQVTEAVCQELFEDLCEPLPAAVETLVKKVAA